MVVAGPELSQVRPASLNGASDQGAHPITGECR